MSVRLGFAEGPGGDGAAEAELAAFLGRLVRWDRAAVVRLRSAAEEPALGVFGQPPFGGVLAVKSMALRGGGIGEAVDATVSAGELLEAVAEAAQGGEFGVPRSVTGPAWAGLLPPRGGWRREAEFEGAAVRELAARVVAEFRARTEALVPERRTRAELDGLAEELWRRPLPVDRAGTGGTAVTLRSVHAAHALGFLSAQGRDDTVAVLSAGAWVRLRTAYGSVATRGASAGAGLTVSPA
ncbi:hypothetical protein [Actinacidiphila sp. ITFR-21]|uniref:hypothetical protein n=1 Tax=Actinacidiphila sp. ITFR-21 TaxID=3075199 RepID=UPI00288A940A|nr:hypothetical protein [Streptomyces sp. ITFR-21]WNI15530.1 hypothetical protein RLT57_08330 [Streptomyces sp. ITFR-21]